VRLGRLDEKFGTGRPYRLAPGGHETWCSFGMTGLGPLISGVLRLSLWHWQGIGAYRPNR
jgi:hypothetical protein